MFDLKFSSVSLSLHFKRRPFKYWLCQN